jgi:hypothetical protein
MDGLVSRSGEVSCRSGDQESKSKSDQVCRLEFMCSRRKHARLFTLYPFAGHISPELSAMLAAVPASQKHGACVVL